MSPESQPIGPKSSSSAPRRRSGDMPSPPFRASDVPHGAILVVAIANATELYELGLDDWIALVHQLQLRLEPALPDWRFSMQPGHPRDGGRTTIVAPLQPATSPATALSLLLAAESLLAMLDGAIMSRSGAVLRLQATLHAGRYLASGCRQQSGWACRVCGDAINQALALDERNRAGCIQVSPQAAALLGPLLPPDMLDAAHRAYLAALLPASTFEIRYDYDTPPNLLPAGWGADAADTDDEDGSEGCCEGPWQMLNSTAIAIIHGALLSALACATLRLLGL